MILNNTTAVEIYSPVTGSLKPIEECPDEIFAQKMVGDGLMISPDDGDVLSPVSGHLVQVASGGHAVGIETSEGLEVLVHVGIDTVKLEGEGFNTLVKKGDNVKKGDVLLEVDWNFLEENAPSTLTPVLITNQDLLQEIKFSEGEVTAGKDIIMEAVLS